jgi:hypothetical protein
MEPSEAERYQDLCTVIGEFTIKWALTEMAFDGLVLTLFKLHQGAKLDKEIPRALKRKVDFARRCFNQVPSLAPFATDAHYIIDAVYKAGNERHTLVHGVVSNLSEFQATGKFSLLRTIHEKEIIHFESEQLELLDIAMRASMLPLLTEALHGLANRLVALAENEAIKTSGEGGS